MRSEFSFLSVLSGIAVALPQLLALALIERAERQAKQAEVKAPAHVSPDTGEKPRAPLSPDRGEKPPFPLSPSYVIHSRYEVLKGIESGATSFVYLVRDLSFAEDKVEWVMKEIALDRFPQLEKNEAVELFSRECRLLSELNHSSIPKLIDSFQEGEKLYLIMEHVEGEDLETLVKRAGKPLDLSKIVKIAEELTGILAYLHSRSPSPVIFRDLKPSNIMLTGKGHVRLIDFGISRFYQHEKERDTFVYGTVGFSPPEQYGTGQSDERSDVYALGATLYYLLTLEEVEGFNFNFPPLRKFNRNVPPMLERIIMKCLKKAPLERYQSSESLLEDMKALGEQAAALDESSESDVWIGIPVIVTLSGILFVFLLYREGSESIKIFSSSMLVLILLKLIYGNVKNLRSRGQGAPK